MDLNILPIIIIIIHYYSFITPEGSTYWIGYRYKKKDTLHTLIAPKQQKIHKPLQ